MKKMGSIQKMGAILIFSLLIALSLEISTSTASITDGDGNTYTYIKIYSEQGFSQITILKNGLDISKNMTD